jgi:hypothetical protein
MVFTAGLGFGISGVVLGAGSTQRPKIRSPRLAKRQPEGLIPVFAGSVRVPGTIVWTSKKFIKKKGSYTDTVVNLAVVFARNYFDRPVRLESLIIDGEKIKDGRRYGNDNSFRYWFYEGDDPAAEVPEQIQKHQGGLLSAWRGFCMVVIRGLSLENYGREFPKIEAVLSSYTELSADGTEFITPLSAETGVIPIWDDLAFTHDWDYGRIFYVRSDYSGFGNPPISEVLVCTADIETQAEVTAYPVTGSTIGDFNIDPSNMIAISGTSYVLMKAYVLGTYSYAVIDFSTGLVVSTLAAPIAGYGLGQMMDFEDGVARERIYVEVPAGVSDDVNIIAISTLTGELRAIELGYVVSGLSGVFEGAHAGMGPNGFPGYWMVMKGTPSKLHFVEYNGADVSDFVVLEFATAEWNSSGASSINSAEYDQSENRMLLSYEYSGSGRYAIVDFGTGETVYTGSTPSSGWVGTIQYNRYERGHRDIRSHSGWHRLLDLETGTLIASDRETDVWWSYDETTGRGYRVATDGSGYSTFEIRFYPGSGRTIRSIDDLLADLAVYGGYDRANISAVGLDGIPAYGWVIDFEEVTPLEILQQICDLYGIMIIESGDGLIFRRAATDDDYDVDETVEEADLVIDSGTGAAASGMREAELDLPGAIEVEYWSRQNDEIKTVSAKRPSGPLIVTKSELTQTISVPLCMDDDEVKELAYRRLYSAAAESTELSFTLPPHYAYVEPGDIVRLNLDAFVIDVQVLQADSQPNLTVQCVGRTLLEVADMTSDGEGLADDGGEDTGEYTLPPTRNVTVPMIAASGQVFAPTVVGGGVAIAPALIAATGGVFAPAVIGGEQIISPALIAATGQVYAPTLTDGTTDPNFADVVFLSGFEGADGSTTLTEESSYGHSMIVRGNAQIDTAQAKYGSSSGLFDGTGDDWHALHINELTNLSPTNTDPFTIEAWVRIVSHDWRTIAAVHEGSSVRSWIFQTTPAGELALYWYGSGAGQNLTSSGAGITTGAWHHLAVDKDSSGKIRLYVNGVKVADSTPADSTLKYGLNCQFSVGAWASGASEVMNGWIDELRITRGVARYATDTSFTPPAAAFPRS